MMYWTGDSWGWAGWLMMGFSMLVFWGLVAWVAVTLVRTTSRPYDPRSGHPDEILAERYARGEIDDAEYRRRLDILRDGPPTRHA